MNVASNESRWSTALSSEFSASRLGALSLIIDDVAEREFSGSIGTPPDTRFDAKKGGETNGRKIENVARNQILADAADDLRLMRKDIRSRANRSFDYIVAFSAIATITILVSIGFSIAGAVPAASLSAVAAVLSGGAASAFWKVYQIETRRADSLMTDLQKIEVARVNYLLAERAGNGANRIFLDRRTSESE
ncbi:hypothetical protein ACFXG4_31865 [Nocardia sp. NPDC059246]|uniref:hypothetical protein n=1 Tax=unclassified Nocardia TaxID=2637762 RepID=UPI0036CD1CCC